MLLHYRTTLRPPAFGGLPLGVKWCWVEVPPDPAFTASNLPRSRHRYGVVEVDRELTPAELHDFDIVRVSD